MGVRSAVLSESIPFWCLRARWYPPTHASGPAGGLMLSDRRRIGGVGGARVQIKPHLSTVYPQPIHNLLTGIITTKDVWAQEKPGQHTPSGP